MSNNSQPTIGNGKICYMELPSRDVNESSDFYQRVFGWDVRRRGDGATAFDDGVGQVSGTWRTDRNPSVEIGILVHIMVDDMEVTIKKVKDHGGTIVQPVGMDAPEITAHFRDPSGNILGLYQEPSK
jgi:predicted enzyme related to lactoylglutathione lyase